MMNTVYRLMTGILILVSAVQITEARAQENSNSYFARGVEYSRNGDCEKALNEFNQANRNGMNEPRLYYNIGVCEYRLKHYTEARQAFVKAGRSPQFLWLANYNIGLVEKARNNLNLANGYFQDVYKHAPDSRLRSLAGYQLGLEADVSAWRGVVISSLGHDDNIVDPAQLASSRGDFYIDALIYSSKVLSGTASDGINLKLSAYAIRYQQVNVYDMNQFQIGLGKTFTASAWENEAAIDAIQSTLGGLDYLRTLKLSASSEKRLNDTDAIKLRYSYSNIQALLPQNAFLEGVNHKARASWKTKKNDRELLLAYVLEMNRRNNQNTATTFTSYSPTRHSVEIKADAPLADRMSIEGGMSYRISNYADANILGTGQVINRSDSRLMLDMKIKRTISRSLEVSAEYNFTNNESNIAAYSFKRNQVSIGLEAQF